MDLSRSVVMFLRDLMSLRGVSVSTSCDMFIVDTVLSFVKKGDTNSLKIKKLVSVSVSAAKQLLWDSCAQALRSFNLPYQQRRDSDKRKQFTADIEDLSLAFDALPFIVKLVSCPLIHWLSKLSKTHRF